MPSLVAGGVLGVLSGVTGVGGGIFLTPLVLALGWAGARQVAAISAVFNLLKSGPPWRAHGHHARPAFGASTLAAMCGCRRVYRLVVGNELFEARNVAQDFSLPPDSRGTADDRKRCRVTERVSGGEPDCSIVVGWSSLFSRMLTATSARHPTSPPRWRLQDPQARSRPDPRQGRRCGAGGNSRSSSASNLPFHR